MRGKKKDDTEVKPMEEKDTTIYSSKLKSCLTFLKQTALLLAVDWGDVMVIRA